MKKNLNRAKVVLERDAISQNRYRRFPRERLVLSSHVPYTVRKLSIRKNFPELGQVLLWWESKVPGGNFSKKFRKIF